MMAWEILVAMGLDRVHDGCDLTEPTMTNTASTFELTPPPVTNRGVSLLALVRVSAVGLVAVLLLGALLLLAHGAWPPF